jgi:response regulator RpfG family c-di-GMP phosphodiesterase
LASEHRDPINLVVTDVVMPGLSGPEVVRKLTDTRDVKVLYVSGYPDRAIASRGIFTPQNFLQKPFRHEVLLRKVREVLDR